MKKQTKIVAVASAAAMLAIGASMTSFAATGWVEEDGQWYYYDKDGNRVEDEWKKSGDNWYWLDSEENGAMATDKLVEDDDDTYYVDANGVMVKNTWVKVVNEDQDDDDDPAEYRYYYMQNSGKAYKASDNTSSVKFKTIDGKKCEPIEEMTVDCPEEYSGTVIDLTTRRKGTLTNMASDGERTRLEFDIPSRGIIGLRSNMLTATAGEAIMTHRLKGFEPWVGEIEMRTNGSIISGETGTAYAYSIDKLQDRGRFFISPMEQVYAGQVIGEHTRQNDITVNVTKAKQLTNMRASGSDDKTSIAPPKVFTLEEALEYIQGDEYVEVTPHSMRLRKILLDENDRKRAAK